MIENIVLNLTKSDTQLAQLTGGRIYPDGAQVKTLPTVIMYADAPTSPTENPWEYTQNITFEIYAKTEKEAQAVRNRFYDLFNRYDAFYAVDKKAGIIIREAHAVFASVSNHFPLETEQAKEKAASFDFRYTKCAVAQGE